MADEDKKTEDAAAPAEEAKEEAAPAADVPSSDDAGEDQSRQGEAEAEVEVPAEYKDLIEKIEKMSVLELHGLVKTLEKKFGVSAAAVAVAGPAAGGDAGGAEEQDSFTVELKDAGSQKIAIIKVVKELMGLGLKEAKDLVDGVPATLKEGVKKEEAEEIKAKVEEAGGSVELK